MGLKIAIISFFLMILTIMMVMWVNSIPTEKFSQNGSGDQQKPIPSGQIERIKVGPNLSPKSSIEPSPTDDEVLGVTSSPSGSPKGKICQNECGNDICQLVVCQGSGCPCVENEFICPKDCR